jgi:uncharacterized protein
MEMAHGNGPWRIDMARMEKSTADFAPLGAMPEGDTLFRLGMQYARDTGTSDARIAAHKWFNIAAMHGNADAARLRREIAEDMTAVEIAVAQRAARDWVVRH